LAAVELVRASVYYQLEELQTAEFHAQRAEHTYAHLGHKGGRIKALFLRGSINYLALALDTAVTIFQQVIDFGKDAEDVEWIARGSYGRGNCELERGNLSEASTLFHSALITFRHSGRANERIATEWGLARVVLYGGKPGEAARRLREVMRAFEGIGMVMDAAIAGVDLAEALIVLRQPHQVAKVAEHSFRVLKRLA
jgi:hypothetical protein